MHGLILSDNWTQYNEFRQGIRRNPSAHVLANFLRENHMPVDVIDFLHDFSVDELAGILQNTRPEFVAVNATLDKPYIDWTLLRSRIRELVPEAKIIVFGERVLRLNYDQADFYVEGYSETAVLNILKNPNQVVATANGLVLATDHKNNMRQNSFSVRYLESDFAQPAEFMTIGFSRGCIFSCAFCNHTAIGVRKQDFEKNSQAIVDEFIYAYQQYGITKFSITDSTFNDTTDKTDLLVKISKMIPEKIQVVCFLRLDLLYKQPGLLDKLIEAGVVAVHFGIDSLNPETGKAIGKTVDPDTLKQYLQHIRSRYPDLFMYGTFIVGLPKDSVQHHKEICCWLNQELPLDMWYWFPLSIKQNNGSGEVLSPIEQDYEKYGYKSSTSTVKILASGRGIRDQKLQLIPWKTDYIDLAGAVDLCRDLNDSSSQNIKCNPWLIFDMSVVYQNVDWWLKFHPTRSQNKPYAELHQNTKKFVSQYKEKKLDYFNS
jgi:Radical SAM superfamily